MANLSVLSKDTLLEHWQGHRRLTRRVIEAFTETSLYSFTPGAPLRPFGEQVSEALEWPEPSLKGMLTDSWEFVPKYEALASKTQLLAAWDESGATLERLWADITPETLEAVTVDPWFGSAPMSHLARVLYLIDNEVHHRGQGYVYLRLLGLEPPLFYER